MLWIWNRKMQIHPKSNILYIMNQTHSPWNGIQYWFELNSSKEGSRLERNTPAQCCCPSHWTNSSNTVIGFSHPYSPRLVWYWVGCHSFSRVPGAIGHVGTGDGDTHLFWAAHACPPRWLACVWSFWIRQKLAVAITEAMSISGIVSNYALFQKFFLYLFFLRKRYKQPAKLPFLYAHTPHVHMCLSVNVYMDLACV